jgi:hypothetical protein
LTTKELAENYTKVYSKISTELQSIATIPWILFCMPTHIFTHKIYGMVAHIVSSFGWDSDPIYHIKGALPYQGSPVYGLLVILILIN